MGKSEGNSPCIEHFWGLNSQSSFICAKLTMETLEQGVEYIQS